MVTSPPYFAGKEYEESLGRNGVPGSYFEYLALLKDVFIGVQAGARAGRPHRRQRGQPRAPALPLARRRRRRDPPGPRVLLRGEVIWWKGRAAGGSCAWGTFQRPSNPVLRDVTERIVIASKGRFDRALKPEKRLELELALDIDDLA